MNSYNCINLKRVSIAFTMLTFAVIPLLFSSCENSIHAEFETVKSRNIILVSNEGKEYRIKINKDPEGTDRLEIEPVNK